MRPVASMPIVTAGLKCAPDMPPNAFTATDSASPWASAMPTSPPPPPTALVALRIGADAGKTQKERPEEFRDQRRSGFIARLRQIPRMLSCLRSRPAHMVIRLAANGFPAMVQRFLTVTLARGYLAVGSAAQVARDSRRRWPGRSRTWRRPRRLAPRCRTWPSTRADAPVAQLARAAHGRRSPVPAVVSRPRPRRSGLVGAHHDRGRRDLPGELGGLSVGVRRERRHPRRALARTRRAPAANTASACATRRTAARRGPRRLRRTAIRRRRSNTDSSRSSRRRARASASSWLDGREMAGGHEAGAHGSMALRSAFIANGQAGAEQRHRSDRSASAARRRPPARPTASIVVYRDKSDGEFETSRSSRFSGGQWSAPAIVHADDWQINGCPVNGPAIAALGNDVAVAWYQVKDGEPQGSSRVFCGGALVFDAGPTELGRHVRRLALVMPAPDRAIVSHIERTAEGPQLVLREARRDGRTGTPLAVGAMTNADARAALPASRSSADGWSWPGSTCGRDCRRPSGADCRDQVTQGSEMRSRGLTWLIVLVAALLLAVPSVAVFYTDWLWFKEVGFESLFLRRMNAQALIFAIAFFGVFLVLFVNLRYARRALNRPQIVLGTGLDGRSIAIDSGRLSGIGMLVDGGHLAAHRGVSRERLADVAELLQCGIVRHHGCALRARRLVLRVHPARPSRGAAGGDGHVRPVARRRRAVLRALRQLRHRAAVADVLRPARAPDSIGAAPPRDSRRAAVPAGGVGRVAGRVRDARRPGEPGGQLRRRPTPTRTPGFPSSGCSSASWPLGAVLALVYGFSRRAWPLALAVGSYFVVSDRRRPVLRVRPARRRHAERARARTAVHPAQHRRHTEGVRPGPRRGARSCQATPS